MSVPEKGVGMLHLLVAAVERLSALRRNDDGATAVEYGLIVAAIAAGIIILVGTVGDNVAAAFQELIDNWA